MWLSVTMMDGRGDGDNHVVDDDSSSGHGGDGSHVTDLVVGNHGGLDADHDHHMAVAIYHVEVGEKMVVGRGRRKRAA